MSELRIDVSELKREKEGWVKELAAFLNENLKAEVETAGNEITRGVRQPQTRLL